MIDNMSNKSLVWLSCTLIGAIVIVWAIAQHMEDIGNAWQWARWVLVLIGLLSLLYAIYRLWHAERLRKFDRLKAAAEVGKIESEKWAIEQTLLGKQQIELERVRLEQMKLTLEHERLIAAQQHVTLNAGQTFVKVAPDGRYLPYNAPAQLTRGKGAQPDESEDKEIEIPQAPAFTAMSHLLTPERMVLCYTADGPAYGTAEDLLSMSITGKPGRGKTTALIYYVTMLLQAGAEVWVWDPHGAMGELNLLNGKRLQGMPATAKVVYLDRKDDIVASVPKLQAELRRRDEVYRECLRAHVPYTEHPLLLLADELPVLSDFDEQVEQEYKIINRQHVKDDEDPEEVPSLFYLIRRFVLEARKWNCYFIGSGQSIDAEILPTKVTDAMNSRIVFFNSDRKARMSGLESDAIKNLLPAIRRAGNGVMIMDCARWDEPMIGVIPYIEVKDMLKYLGVHREFSGNGQFELKKMEDLPLRGESQGRTTIVVDAPEYAPVQKITGALETPVNTLVGDAGNTPDEFPALGNDDLEMNNLQVEQFKVLYPAIGNIVECLRQINNGKGQGLGKRYFKHASWIVKSHGLRKEGK